MEQFIVQLCDVAAVRFRTGHFISNKCLYLYNERPRSTGVISWS